VILQYLAQENPAFNKKSATTKQSRKPQEPGLEEPQLLQQYSAYSAQWLIFLSSSSARLCNKAEIEAS